MAKPLLAMVLLTVMAGAWAWTLWPTVPTVLEPTVVPVAMARENPAPVVHLERLDRSGPGIAADQQTDPFRGWTSTRPAPASAAATRPAPPAPAPPPERPRWPRLDLIGLAEGDEGGRPVRTAIVSGPTGVLHARPGDVLEQVYRVERVEPDGVDVRLLPEGRVLRLALRP